MEGRPDSRPTEVSPEAGSRLRDVVELPVSSEDARAKCHWIAGTRQAMTASRERMKNVIVEMIVKVIGKRERIPLVKRKGFIRIENSPKGVNMETYRIPWGRTFPRMTAENTVSSRPSPIPKLLHPSLLPTSMRASTCVVPGTKESNRGTWRSIKR